MADTENEERTEDPTETRREDFRKRGQVAQTRELSSVMVLLGSTLLFWLLGNLFLQELFELFQGAWGHHFLTAARYGDWREAGIWAVKKGVILSGPFFAMSLVLGAGSTLIQTGLLQNEDALTPQWERLNPVEGFKRIFTMRSLVEALKSILKIIVISILIYFLVRSEIEVLPQLSAMEPRSIFLFVGQLVWKSLAVVGAFMTAIAAMDYFFQWWDLEKQMRMTKQEIKEELKSREGDPLIKSRIRRLQKDISRRKMMEKVPKADVVITNPTHIAVAIKYDATMVAPQLVAKGAGVLAERIKALAKENGVPIVENKPVARAIYKTMKLGQTIPRELFTAVAKVLSYVYRLKRKTVS